MFHYNIIIIIIIIITLLLPLPPSSLPLHSLSLSLGYHSKSSTVVLSIECNSNKGYTCYQYLHRRPNAQLLTRAASFGKTKRCRQLVPTSVRVQLNISLHVRRFLYAQETELPAQPRNTQMTGSRSPVSSKASAASLNCEYGLLDGAGRLNIDLD